MNQLKAGALLSYVSIALNNVIGLLYTPFMLRMIGQNEYGLYSLVASIVAYLTVLDLGFGNAIIRYTSKFRAEGKIQEQYEMFGMFLLLYCSISIIALIAGVGLYFNTGTIFGSTMTAEDLDKVRIMLLMMTFNVCFTFPMSIWGAIITAYENFIFQKLVNIVRIILNPLVMILFLCMGYKAIAMVVITTLFNIITLCINAWYCRRKLHIKIRVGKFHWGFFKEVSVYSFWIFLNVIIGRIYWSTGQFILGIYKGAAAISVYAIAVQLQSLYNSFSTAISSVFLPRITTMVTKENNEQAISDLFIRTGRIQYIIMSFILTGFILFGHSFIIIWAGTDYEDAYTISLLLFIPITVPLIQNLGIAILQARNQMKFRSIVYLLIAIASFGISIPLAQKYGGIGCAIGTSSALIIGQIIIMNIYYYKKVHIDIPKFWIEISKMSIAPLIVGIVCWNILRQVVINDFLSLSTAILLFSVFYLPAIWLWTMNNHERNLFMKPIQRIRKKFPQR